MRLLATAVMLAFVFSYSNTAMAALMHDLSVTPENADMFPAVGYLGDADADIDCMFSPTFSAIGDSPELLKDDAKTELVGVIRFSSPAGESGAGLFLRDERPLDLVNSDWVRHVSDERRLSPELTESQRKLWSTVGLVMMVAGVGVHCLRAMCFGFETLKRRRDERKREQDALFEFEA